MRSLRASFETGREDAALLRMRTQFGAIFRDAAFETPRKRAAPQDDEEY